MPLPERKLWQGGIAGATNKTIYIVARFRRKGKKMIANYEIIGERYSEQLGQTVPLLNVHMMSDERYSQLAAQQAVKHYVQQHGHKPDSIAEAFRWQREWVEQMIKD